MYMYIISELEVGSSFPLARLWFPSHQCLWKKARMKCCRVVEPVARPINQSRTVEKRRWRPQFSDGPQILGERRRNSLRVIFVGEGSSLPPSLFTRRLYLSLSRPSRGTTDRYILSPPIQERSRFLPVTGNERRFLDPRCYMSPTRSNTTSIISDGLSPTNACSQAPNVSACLSFA